MVAVVLIAIQVIGAAWSFGAQVCLAGNEACGSLVAVAASEAECCCGHEAQDEEPAPERDPCEGECGCCVQIPAPERRDVGLASVREAEPADDRSASSVCIAWASTPARSSRAVRPPPDVGGCGRGSSLRTIRMQV